MVRGRERLAWIALVAAAAGAGCALITGVGDLDPSLPDGVDPGDSSTNSIDAISEGAGGTDSGSTDVTTEEASTLLGNITFENGQVVHPVTGFDRVLVDGGLSIVTKDANVDESGDATTVTAIGGDYSMQVNAPALAEEKFGLRDEIYITARMRIDAAVTSVTAVIRIQPETGTVPVELRLNTARQLTAHLSTQIGAASPALDIGKVYRVGIYVKKGKNSNGTLQVRIADDGKQFTTPFAQSTNIDFERPEKLQVGMITAATAVTFDDVKIDPTALAPP